MTRTQLIALAAFGSAALLIGAWIFQYFGFAPCKMCIWQRYPHGAAVGFGVLALLLPIAILPYDKCFREVIGMTINGTGR